MIITRLKYNYPWIINKEYETRTFQTKVAIVVTTSFGNSVRPVCGTSDSGLKL